MNIINIFANSGSDIEGDINSLSIRVILIASLILVILLGISSQVIKGKAHESLKKPLFMMIAATIILPSLLLMGSTVYINTISESNGPVHWHTDIEMWVCGEEIELRNPTGFLSNKIGTSTYHEHDDKRIHLEGVVVEKEYDASLEKFFDVTGGKISENNLTIPTETGSIFENDVDGDTKSGDTSIVQQYVTTDSEDMSVISVNNGDTCYEGASGKVQAFVYSFNKSNDTYTQTKLHNPAEYLMRDESVVPPGDCVIVEFDIEKDTTNKLCQQFGVRDSKRCVEFGVTQFNPELCNLTETTKSGSGGAQ